MEKRELVQTLSEAAVRLEISPFTLKKRCLANREPGCLKIGGRWRVVNQGPEALDAWDSLPEKLKPSEIGELLKLTKNTVNALIRAGQIPAYRKGRNWRINKTELMTALGLLPDNLKLFLDSRMEFLS
jgi:excisionase family DNA binding protein